MKNLACLLVLCVVGNVFGLTVVDPSYQAEEVLRYSDTGLGDPGYLAILPDGTMYLTHEGTYDVNRTNGSVTKISAGAAQINWVSGLTSPQGIVWGGGTAYGDSLYVAEVKGARISRIALDGGVYGFASVSQEPHSIGIDLTGTYGGLMYTGTYGNDQHLAVLPDGTVDPFSSFPGNGSGSPKGIEFDLYGNYGGGMFVAIDKYDSNPGVEPAGVHMLDTDGIAARFGDRIRNTKSLAIDPLGTMFDGDMFVQCRTLDFVNLRMYRVDTAGNVADFIQSGNITDFAFGPDGTMYVVENLSDETVLSKVTLIPEPATLAMLALGGFALRHRRN